MKSHPCHNSILDIQLIGCLGKLPPHRLNRHHSCPSLCILFPHNAKPFLIRIHRFQSLQKLSGQCKLMTADLFHPCFTDPAKSCMKPHNSRQIHSSRLKPIRHKIRHNLSVADASCSSRNQTLHLRQKLLTQKKAADSLGAQKSLMAGKSQSVNLHAFHIQRPHSGCLGCISNKQKTALPAECSHLFIRHHRSAHIAGVGHYHRPGFLFHQRSHFLQNQASISAAGNPGKRNPLLFQLHQGTHHRIVLHRRNQHMVSRL